MQNVLKSKKKYVFERISSYIELFPSKSFCGYFYWLEINICQKKKSRFFQLKKILGKNCQNPFQAILRLIKKSGMAIRGRGKFLVIRVLKKHFFYMCLPLVTLIKICLSFSSVFLLQTHSQSSTFLSDCLSFSVFRIMNAYHTTPFRKVYRNRA